MSRPDAASLDGPLQQADRVENSPAKVRAFVELFNGIPVHDLVANLTIAVSELQTSKLFYERALEPLGYRLSFGKEAVFWAFDVGDGALFEIQTSDSKPPLTHLHVAFRVNSKAEVDAFYRAALDAGGADNGAPGRRPDYGVNYYACFVLDPDGYNIEAMVDETVTPA